MKFFLCVLCKENEFERIFLTRNLRSMSSFFTLPASQKKRKRSQQPKKRNGAASPKESRDNDSISASDASDDDAPARAGEYEGSEDDDDESGDEDPAAKRIRLAEQYLANTQKEVLHDGGFDAAEIDKDNLRRRMGERLKESTAESKGKLYRWIADDLDWRRAEQRVMYCHGMCKSITGVAVHGTNVYAVSKDMHLVKWELPNPTVAEKGKRASMKAKVVARTRGNGKAAYAQHHHGAILCVAVAPNGEFIATGGADKKLIIWDSSLKPLKVFTHHRDVVTALAFRRGTNQLFSASKDRTVKIWSLDELAYVETLFGHQDEVVDVDALAQEQCVTVGARDRTARLWKVVEESQLVFRGGGASGRSKSVQALRQAYGDDSGVDLDGERAYNEGSMDRIALIDDDTFITASDNGSLSLWNIHKKKAVFTVPLAHGLDPPLPLDQASAELSPDPSLDDNGRGGKQPRWVTALKSTPFSDVFVTGSWDGYIRAWKVSEDKRRIESLGALAAAGGESLDALLDQEGLTSDSLSNAALEALKVGTQQQGRRVEGVISDLAIVDRGERGKDGVMIAAAVGKEHRLGRWKEVADGKNCVMLFSVSRKAGGDNGGSDLDGSTEEHDGLTVDADGFEGFD